MNNLIETLPDWFKQLPEGQALIASQKTETTDRRRAAIAELASVNATFEKQSLPPLLNEIEEARKAVSVAQAALADAERTLWQALARESAARGSHDVQQGRRHAFLRESAPARIDVFDAWLHREIDALRVLPPPRAEKTDLVDARTGRVKKVYSDLESRGRRIKAAVRLLDECENLRVICIDEDDAMKRIEKLKATLPPLEVVELKGGVQ